MRARNVWRCCHITPLLYARTHKPSSSSATAVTTSCYLLDSLSTFSICVDVWVCTLWIFVSVCVLYVLYNILMKRRGGTSANKRGHPRVRQVKPSPYTKVGQGSALRSQSWHFVVKVWNFFQQEKDNGAILIQVQKVVDRSTAVLGLNKCTIYLQFARKKRKLSMRLVIQDLADS